MVTFFTVANVDTAESNVKLKSRVFRIPINFIIPNDLQTTTLKLESIDYLLTNDNKITKRCGNTSVPTENIVSNP